MPPRFHCSAALRAGFALALAFATLPVSTAVIGSSAARAESLDPDSRPQEGVNVSSFAPALKRLQQRLLLQGARARMAHAKALARMSRKQRDQARSGAGVRRRGDANEAGGPQGTGATAPMARIASRAGAAAGRISDVLVNDRAEDAAFANKSVGQAEQMIAVQGSNILVAWNDGIGFVNPANTSTQGYGYSVDGGATYRDGGSPPVPAGWRWASDPLVAVNENTGDFWFCAMVDDNLPMNSYATKNGIALARARFVAGAVQWSTPVLIRSGNNDAILFDKPWLAADSLSGRLYLSYTVIDAVADTIVFQRSSVGGTAWDNPQRLSSDAEAGYVQGSRPAIGPDGEVYVIWYSIGTTSPYADRMRIRRSADQGATFGAVANAASVYSNYGSGAPGFNRGFGVTYPSIAVDRSTGPSRGRVYAAWNESVDFYEAYLGTGGSLTETEPNEGAGTANAFTPGRILNGEIATDTDFDYFSFTGTAGQTVIFYADSVSPGLDMSMRLFCGDGTTRLALSAPGAGWNNFICFTLPVSGTYYLRCAAWQSSTGTYQIYTGLYTPIAKSRARDHRDAFVAWSGDGVTWSTPARVSDSPVGFDDWLPEVAVSGDDADARVGSGRPYCLWYDWRESASSCGGGSNVYLSTSDDHGATWGPAGPLNVTQTDWTSVGSNIMPNQGDYLSLIANQSSLYAAWADGRNGDPDIYGVTIPLLTGIIVDAPAQFEVTPERVTLTWRASALSGLTTTIERRTTTFSDVGQATADGAGEVSFSDTTVSPGVRYTYRLTWLDGGTPRRTGTVVVPVPMAPAAAILYGARPNPASRSQGVFILLSLPDAAPAALELFDVAGRRLARQSVNGIGQHRVNVSEGLSLKSGIYFVRLTHGGRSLTARVPVTPYP